jgi:ankyrin repeat protein
MLLEHGADVMAQNKDGETPLHLASREDKGEVIHMLLEHGAHVMAQNKDGDTPLHLASREGK